MSSLTMALNTYDVNSISDNQVFSHNICNMYLLDNQDL